MKTLSRMGPSVLLCLCLLLYGCELPFMIEEGGLASASEFSVAEGALGGEEGALLRTGLEESATGELTLVNATDVNTLLERIYMEKAPGELPKLYVEGRSGAIAEVHPEQNAIRILGRNEFIPIPNNLFAVSGEELLVRQGPSAEAEVVGHVRHGRMVVRLAEHYRWYEVRVADEGGVKTGWVYAGAVLPLSAHPGDGSNFPASNTAPPPIKDFGSYVNAPAKRTDISIMIRDAKGVFATDCSSDVANVYIQSGKTAGTGLIRSDLFYHEEFEKLAEGNSTVIEKLQLNRYTDYLGLGTITFSFRQGTLTANTIVCEAVLTMTIISTKDHSLYKSFTIGNNNGNGATQSQAREEAYRKLLNNYFTYYASL